jgi:putative ABC transport system permease protein
MTATLVRASLRELARHPWQTTLAVVGIALGVAVVVAIELASASASRALTLSVEAVSGRTTHQVTGGPAGLDEALYRRLRVEAGARTTAPVVEEHVGLPDAPGRSLLLLGVDPFAEGPFRAYVGGRLDLRAFLTEPGTGLLTARTARELGLRRGDALRVRAGGRLHRIRVIGWLEASAGPAAGALDGLLVTDVATAQEVVGRPGRLHRIDLVVPAGAAGARLLAAVAAALPPGAALEPAAARGAFVEPVTRAFRVNLGALSLLALVVGMFLIYNTASFAVVRRRAVIGCLRALGVTRREILALLLLEAALLGLAATGLGLALGALLARGLVALVTRTINDLYFVVTVREVALDPAVLARGALLGLGATLAAALAPALEATTAPPGATWTRASLEARHRRGAPRAALLGLGVLLAGGGLLAWPGAGLATSHAGLFAVLLGAALATPAATVGLMRVADPVARRLGGAVGALAARGVTASLSRTGVAVAALMVALAATVGISVMVASFRGTVARWLETTLVADVYVSAPALGEGRADSSLASDVVARLRAAPGVAAAATYRGARVRAAGAPVQLLAVEPAPASARQLRFLAGAPEAAWRAFEADGAVLVSEPLAYRRGLGVGSRLELETDRGPRAFTVAGVFADYGSDQGVVMLSRRAYEAAWDDRGVSSLGLFAAPGADLARLVTELRARAGPDQALLIRDHRALRQASLEVFDRTFAITEVLQRLGIAVAFVGVLSALMALQLERARELAVLRAQGLGRGQLWGLVTGQTGLLGLAAGLVAVPVGVTVALILVHIINRRSFGWTLEAEIGPGVLAGAVGLAMSAALLAGVYPALRMARASPAAGLREE